MHGSPGVTHIGIEATRLLREQRGIGRYVRNVLLQIVAQRPAVHFTLYVRRARDHVPLLAQLMALSPDVGTRCRIVAGGDIATSTADVVWYPWNWIRPRSRTAPMVPTIQDLAPMLQFDHRWWRVLKRRKAKRRYQATTDDATLILTISSFTASEITRLLHVDPTKIRITLLAADDVRIADAAPFESPSCEVLARLGVPGPFFLTVGAHDARKNLQVVYRAMALLNDRDNAYGHDNGNEVPLVQCGPGVDPSHPAVDTTWMRAAGYVSDADLAALYQRATALVFPSRYEGFGLPVAEAMRVGGRVICASESSLPEVGGDVALYFPWDDASALASTMARLLGDAALRDELTLRAPRQAARFSWARCAAETLAVFDEAAQR